MRVHAAWLAALLLAACGSDDESPAGGDVPAGGGGQAAGAGGTGASISGGTTSGGAQAAGAGGSGAGAQAAGTAGTAPLAGAGGTAAVAGAGGAAGAADAAPTVDPDATPETRALFESLRDLAATQVLVGMENATREGEFESSLPIDGYHSDIRQVCDQGPMIHGFDIAAVVGDWWPGNASQQQLMDQFQAEYLDHMKLIYDRGGVITMAWHALNPIDDSDAWNGPHELWQLVEPSRCAALEGSVGTLSNCGAAFSVFESRVEILADFVGQMVTDGGTPIPVILRPFHENSGGWFWWGASGVDASTYQETLLEVWSWMVDYFAQTRDLHQVLWAISPNGGGLTRDSYLAVVPDMNLVDIVGYDIYPDDMTDHLGELGIVVNLAEEYGKVPAITETGPGLAGDPAQWGTDVWSQRVLGPVLNDATAQRVAYLMLWYNRPGSNHWGPYASHESAADFRTLCTGDKIAMEGEVNLY